MAQQFDPVLDSQLSPAASGAFSYARFYFHSERRSSHRLGTDEVSLLSEPPDVFEGLNTQQRSGHIPGLHIGKASLLCGCVGGSSGFQP